MPQMKVDAFPLRLRLWGSTQSPVSREKYQSSDSWITVRPENESSGVQFGC